MPDKPTKTARAPRVIDPEIAKLNAEKKAKVEAYRAQQKSAEILKRITDEMVPKLTLDDRFSLLGHLQRSTEPEPKKA